MEATIQALIEAARAAGSDISNAVAEALLEIARKIDAMDKPAQG